MVVLSEKRCSEIGCRNERAAGCDYCGICCSDSGHKKCHGSSSSGKQRTKPARGKCTVCEWRDFKGGCAGRRCRSCCLEVQASCEASPCPVHHIRDCLLRNASELMDSAPAAQSQLGYLSSRDPNVHLDPTTHTYRILGVKKPSVSSILDQRLGTFKHAKARIQHFHRRKPRAVRESVRHKLSVASAYGIALHAVAARWWLSPEATRQIIDQSTSDPCWQRLRDALESLWQQGWRPFRVELPVYGEMAAGTPDVVLRRPAPQVRKRRSRHKQHQFQYMVLDYKRSLLGSQQQKKRTQLQLSLYNLLLQTGGYLDNPQGSVLLFALCVHPTRHTAKLVEFSVDPEAESLYASATPSDPACVSMTADIDAAAPSSPWCRDCHPAGLSTSPIGTQTTRAFRMHFLPKHLPFHIHEGLQHCFETAARAQAFTTQFLPFLDMEFEDESLLQAINMHPDFKLAVTPGYEVPDSVVTTSVADALSQWRSKNRVRRGCSKKSTTIKMRRSDLVNLLRKAARSPALAAVTTILGSGDDEDLVSLTRTAASSGNRQPLHRFYVRVPRERTCDGCCPPPSAPTDVVSIDEGVRTMLTMCFASGKVIEWGQKRDLHTMETAALQGDAIQSAYTQPSVPHHRRHAMKQARLRLFAKNRNRRRDLHSKSTKFLAENAAVVISGELSPTIQRTKRTRTLGKATVKQWLSWSHFEWRRTLTHRQDLYHHLTYIKDDEPWTTRTCSCCGTVRPQFAGKTFKCINTQCNLIMDRDVNAARNILIRYLTVTDPASTKAWLKTFLRLCSPSEGTAHAAEQEGLAL